MTSIYASGSDFKMDDPFLSRARVIDEILAHPDSFTVIRLMQHYDIDSDKDTFVVALIARLMLAEGRRSTPPLG
jgi:hypothetical protein